MKPQTWTANDDYFVVLGLPWGATPQLCAEAFRRRSATAGAADRARLVRAREILCDDPVRRAEWMQARRERAAATGVRGSGAQPSAAQTATRPAPKPAAAARQNVSPVSVGALVVRRIFGTALVVLVATIAADLLVGRWVHGHVGATVLVEGVLAFFVCEHLHRGEKRRIAAVVGPFVLLLVGCIADGSLAGGLSQLSSLLLVALLIADSVAQRHQPTDDWSGKVGSRLLELIAHLFERKPAPTGQMRMHLNADRSLKRSYVTPTAAWAVAARQGAQEGQVLSAYACPVCGAWHVGHGN